jgi:hypothetical protein
MIERAVLPDIAFPPPAEGDIEEDILEQILPEDDCSLSGSDSLQFQEKRSFVWVLKSMKRCNTRLPHRLITFCTV